MTHHTTTRLTLHHHAHPHTTLRRSFHLRTRNNLHTQSPSIPTCPLPCSCAAMPEELDIDRERALGGTVPPYAKHVVVETGREDWGRRIEDEEAEGEGWNFARSLKGLVGPGGKFYNPERPILITNSSHPAGHHGPKYASVNVYPNQIRVPKIEHTPEQLEMFVSQFLHGKVASTRWFRTRAVAPGVEARVGESAVPTPEESIQALTPKLQCSTNKSPTILICGHNSRDTRCGILGPLLRAEFNSYIAGPLQRWLDWVHQPGAALDPFQPLRELRDSTVALTSHIGGHAFAGNVIIYLPKTLVMLDGKRSPLAGSGIWYGRVEPRHVWGIMEETFLRGSVIEELLRGVHKSRDMNG